MTPDAVIHRYLQLIARPRVDMSALCGLIGSDADLLARWLRLLDCDADVGQLNTRLSSLSPEDFKALAQAQAWFVLPIVGSARLSLEQWQSVLQAACLAEVLAEELADADVATRAHVRTRALLALSGVSIDHDQKLGELIEFRGINPVLLEDAHLELKIFSVVDGVETGRETELARQLLNLSHDEFNNHLARGHERMLTTIQDAGIEIDEDIDWAHRIWLRQQISIACSCFNKTTTIAELLAAHRTVSRTLFSTVPELLMVQDGKLVSAIHSGVAISQTNVTSRIAQCLRVDHPLPITDSTDLAVVDRQVLHALDADDALALPVQLTEPLAVLVVKTDEDVDVDFAATLYAEEVMKSLIDQQARTEEKAARELAGADSSGARDLALFRAAETQRLREIVHEANNPLSIVHNYLHILGLRLQDDSELTEQLDMIAQELRRAGDVIASAREVPEMVAEALPSEQTTTAEFNLTDTVRRTGELHRGYANEHGVTVEVQVDPHPLPMDSDQDKLTQVLTNLLKNAIEACHVNDTVSLVTKRNVYRNGQPGVEIIVEDTGPGIDANVLAVLFEPKDTTKGGEHQGLGLHLTYRLINELGGFLDVRTALDQGTAFHVFLPRIDH